MMKNIEKNIYKVFVFFIMLFCISSSVYALENKILDDKNKVLLNAKIVDDLSNLDIFITRSDFAKMIAKSSSMKDKVDSNIGVAICNDVNINEVNAGYIKVCIDNNYMILNMYGNFRPNEFVTYSDVARACTTLLSYKDSDFIGNKVIARNNKFVALKLDEGIEKEKTDFLTKQEVMIAIYNTLNEIPKDNNKKLGLLVFDKMKEEDDGELNADDMIEKLIKGPKIFKKVEGDISTLVTFPLNDDNVYRNGLKSTKESVMDDLNTYQYILYSIDDNRKIFFAYTEDVNINNHVQVKKGYITKINYSLTSQLTPISVEIDSSNYYLANADVRLKFSYSGSIKDDDYVVCIYNKMNDIENYTPKNVTNSKKTADADEEPERVDHSYDPETFKGSIMFVEKFEIQK